MSCRVYPMGVVRRERVRKAARLAVYDETTIRVKNHQTASMTRAEIDVNKGSPPAW